MLTTIAGIPCWIEIDDVFVQKPDSRADNPDDYFGYAEIEFTVCDRNGRPAPWLERKMKDEDRMRIEVEILEQRKNDENDQY